MQILSRFSVSVALAFFLCGSLFSQPVMSREEYIDRFRDIAVTEMRRTGIPASITLAQGILESGAGNSRLALQANNHFGIKCHDWTGPSITHDDDAKGECFRKYNSPEESYRDHSVFLMTRQRYAFLFDYKPTDYTSWAHGLKKAGYATNPQYPQLLLKLIADHALNQYDDPSYKVGKIPLVFASKDHMIPRSGDEMFLRRLSESGVREINGIPFLFAKEGDTFKDLRKTTGFSSGRLARWNELERKAILFQGQIVLFGNKKSRGDVDSHTVVSGESWYSISQRYGIKLDRLLKMNKVYSSSAPVVGQKIRLR